MRIDRHTDGADGRTDRKTDMTKLIVPFSNFANASNIVQIRRIFAYILLRISQFL